MCPYGRPRTYGMRRSTLLRPLAAEVVGEPVRDAICQFAHNPVSSYVNAVIAMAPKSAEFRGFWHRAGAA